jgi:microcystin-dependent protein
VVVPDLRNCFIIGAGSTYNVCSIGGNLTVTLNGSNLPTHTHSVNYTEAVSATGSFNRAKDITGTSTANYSGTAPTPINIFTTLLCTLLYYKNFLII